MGKLIEVDKVKKKFPIMENDFGMVVNETLHKELDKITPVEAIPKTEYENRLKADLVAILTEIQLEMEELEEEADIGKVVMMGSIYRIIQQKIDLLQKQTTDNCDNCFNGTTKGGCAVKELMKNKDCKYYMPTENPYIKVRK